MFDTLLAELQKIAIIAVSTAGTALCGYAFAWLRTYLGIKESDSNEAEIRNAALTEAGKLVINGNINDPQAVLTAAAKVVADLPDVVRAEKYDTADIKDMIFGAAATVFPPANLLKLLK